MNTYKITLTKVIFPLLLISTISCSSRATQIPATRPPGEPTLTVQTAQLPDGTYTYDPSFALKLSKGHFTVTDRSTNAILWEGSYTVAGDLIAFTDEKVNVVWECPNPPKTYTYRWAFDRKALTFTTVKDECGNRVTVLTIVSMSYNGDAN